MAEARYGPSWDYRTRYQLTAWPGSSLESWNLERPSIKTKGFPGLRYSMAVSAYLQTTVATVPGMYLALARKRARPAVRV